MHREKKRSTWVFLNLDIRPFQVHHPSLATQNSSQQCVGIFQVLSVGLSQALCLDAVFLLLQYHDHVEGFWEACRLGLFRSLKQRLSSPHDGTWPVQNRVHGFLLRRLTIVSILLSHSASLSPPILKISHLFQNEKTHDHITYLLLTYYLWQKFYILALYVLRFYVSKSFSCIHLTLP